MHVTKSKGKTAAQDAFDTIAGFRDLVNESFEKLTGKSVAAWLKEFQQRTRELPPSGEQAASQQEPAMSLANAYMVLGLPQTASLEEVKRNYRSLSAVFHPDRGGFTEAMALLNNAYEEITRKEKREG